MVSQSGVYCAVISIRLMLTKSVVHMIFFVSQLIYLFRYRIDIVNILCVSFNVILIVYDLHMQYFPFIAFTQ